jgi:cytochrome c
MKIIMLCLSLVLTVPVLASPELAQKKGCMACHAVDKKMVGPSFQEVSRKYQKTAAETLASSIRSGGSGRWGPIPMPAQPHVNETEARDLARWIQTLKSGG